MYTQNNDPAQFTGTIIVVIILVAIVVGHFTGIIDMIQEALQ